MNRLPREMKYFKEQTIPQDLKRKYDYEIYDDVVGLLFHARPFPLR
jgi:hypothetical protein